jgi:hypothetical protein
MILKPAGAGEKAGARRPDAQVCLDLKLSRPAGSWLRLFIVAGVKSVGVPPLRLARRALQDR